MTTTVSSRSSGSFGYVSIVGMLVGILVFAYGLLLVSLSPLGGAWIAAVGLSTFLGALFATEWAGRRLGLSTSNRMTLSWAFTGIAVILLVSFLAINGMGFEENSASST
jgi:hypothetical protein